MLEVKALKRLPIPRYPMREAVLADPELLKRLPKRWRVCRQAAVAAGLTASLALLALGCEHPTDSQDTISNLIMPQETPQFAGAPTAAPLLTEADALAMISGILKTNDPNMVTNADETGLQKPVYVFYDYDSNGFEAVDLGAGDGRIDFYDAATGAGIEYVGDGEGWNWPEGTAKPLTPEKGKTYVLALDSFSQMTQESEIRQQIHDFLEWLKSQGIG